MINYDAGDVVLVQFPFADLATRKKRPAVVVSPSSFSATYGDLVVVALTGQPQADASSLLNDWQAAGLLKPTWIKRLVATLSTTLVEKKIGNLTSADSDRVRKVIEQIIAVQFRP